MAVYSDAELSDGISGLIQRDRDGYAIKVSGAEHEYRRRFTMAHELGHYLLHRSILDEEGGTNDNRLYRNDINGRAYNSQIEDIHERQANSFAANLLMPEEAVRRVWLEEARKCQGGVPTLTALHRRFRVSPSAMKWRLKNLGLDYAK